MKRPAAIEIAIANEQAILPLDRRLTRRAVRGVLGDAGVRKARISVAVVDDAAIVRLNWQYLRHRGPADVLSFPLEGNDGVEGNELEGEVIASAETALRVAREYGWPPRDELLLYVIHGALHLVGYDDTTAKERKKMQERERDVLAKLGIVRK